MTEKVHLLDLRLRTSAAGNQYLSGWLGKAAVVGFLDREAEGEIWNIYVSTPAPRSGASAESTPRRKQRAPRSRSTELPADGLDDRLDDI